VCIGEWRGAPLYHASLDRNGYDAALISAGFRIQPLEGAGDGGLAAGARLALRG